MGKKDGDCFYFVFRILKFSLLLSLNTLYEFPSIFFAKVIEWRTYIVVLHNPSWKQNSQVCLYF